MTVYEINPLREARWAEFLERHPRSSVFHTPGWLEALHRTYGYEPTVLTTTTPGAELNNGIVFCRIHSWLTGRRLVSLPFSDHCEPLVGRDCDLDALLHSLEKDVKDGKWSYIEIRPLQSCVLKQLHVERSHNAFYFHTLDLRESTETLFRNLHKSCVQRKIRRAEREGLTCEEGTSESILASFYTLFLKTRRRHHSPAQPIEWFRNLICTLREKVMIRIAVKEGRPIAGIFTLSHKQSVVYKYGCSDFEHNNLGGTAFLFWRTILAAKASGMTEFDLGRTDPEAPGLLAFKDHWGTTRSLLTYVRYGKPYSDGTASRWTTRLGRDVFGRLPDSLLAAAGRFVYPHLG